MRAAHPQPASLKRIWHQAKVIATELQEGNDARRREILEGIVRRIDISTTSMAIRLDRGDVAQILKIDSASIKPNVDDPVALTVPIELRRRGVEARLVIAGAGGPQSHPDQQLCFLIAQAHIWFEEIASGDATSVRVIATRDKVHESEVSRALPLAFLAPDIVAAILDGRQPVEMTVKSLRRISDLPSDWDHQQRLLSFTN